MDEFKELTKDAPKFEQMERGELVAYTYGLLVAGNKVNAENVELKEELESVRKIMADEFEKQVRDYRARHIEQTKIIVELELENERLREYLGGGSIVTHYWKDEDGMMHVLTTDGEHTYEYQRGGLAEENARLNNQLDDLTYKHECLIDAVTHGMVSKAQTPNEDVERLVREYWERERQKIEDENEKLRSRLDILEDHDQYMKTALSEVGCDECGEYKQEAYRLFEEVAKLRELVQYICDEGYGDDWFVEKAAALGIEGHY